MYISKDLKKHFLDLFIEREFETAGAYFIENIDETSLDDINGLVKIDHDAFSLLCWFIARCPDLAKCVSLIKLGELLNGFFLALPKDTSPLEISDPFGWSLV